MGAVYVATDQRFGSTVALKETFFSDPALRRAFEREARLLNRLRHPALPRVSDHFSEGEGQFLVMEYIPGEDLSDMLEARGGGFPVRDVLAWADQLLDALEYLHTQEPPVVHRDIKPQNLKLLPRNQIVLLDFGLAKGTPRQTLATKTASVFGYSVNYAPLEQMQGERTGTRSDLYSLGATLYHLLTGSTPPDALTRASAVLNEQPDPLRPASELNPLVPAELSDVLARAMRQSAAQRFDSAAEMREALRRAGGLVSDETAATPAGTANAAAISSEQETRLLGGARPTAAAGVGGRATGVNSSPDAATLLSADATAAAASVVTRVRGEEHSAPARRPARRALTIAVSLVVVAIVGAAVYSLAGRERSETPAAQPLTQPAATTPSPAEQQPAPAATQPAQQAEPTPVTAPASADSQRRPPAAKPPAPKPEGGEADAPARHPPHAEPPEIGPPPDPRSDPESPFRNRDWRTNPPTAEEMEQYRRAAEARRRERALRRRALEERRRPRVPPTPPE